MKAMKILFAVALATAMAVSAFAQPHRPQGKQLPSMRTNRAKSELVQNQVETLQTLTEKVQALEAQNQDMQARMANCMAHCHEKGADHPMKGERGDLKSPDDHSHHMPISGGVQKSDGKDKLQK